MNYWSPVICLVWNLKNDVWAPRGVQTTPSRAKVLRLEVAEVQVIANILLMSLSNFRRTVIVVTEELMGLVEIVIDPEIESVPRLEILNRAWNTM